LYKAVVVPLLALSNDQDCKHGRKAFVEIAVAGVGDEGGKEVTQ